MFLYQIKDIVKVFINTSDNDIARRFNMAKIIEGKRKTIILSTDDVLNIVRQYQVLTSKSCCYEHTRELISKNPIYLPEDIN